MFQWKENFQWIFSNLGSSDKVGVNESGIGIFKRQPYKGLAKEILQNVTDAKNPELPDEIPVRAKFELIYVDLEDIPGHERLREVIHKCSEYYSDGDDGEKLRSIRDAADKYFSGDTKVPVLKISDYNTTGLRGVKEETGSNWTGLVRERSATNKSNASSGAFGVGKFAPYNFTSVRTVLYSTKTINDEYAFQGKAILTTFKEDGKNKQNIGLFADKDSENFDAVFDVNDIAPVFRRTETGTDIFVLGFVKEDEDTWVEQSAISVIEYFFYSIYRGKLEVEIRDGEKRVEITQNNLGEMITFYEKYCKEHMADDTAFKFTAPSYWRLLQDSRHKIIKAPFEYNGKSMGNYELYLLTGDDVVEKKVLEMRQAGMKIREDCAFRIPMNFTAIFIATGEGAASQDPKDNISSFLRKCENQAHDDWAADEYKEEKTKRILPIVLTLNQFGGLAVNTSLILEKEESQPYPWVCNWHDLENIIEILKYLNKEPEDFIDYIIWRIESHPNVLSSDELNVIEGYFMNSQARKQNGAIFFPANGPSLIDKIYFEKHAIPYEYPVATTVVRKKKKIGRNEPCPCGSGKKFKKCCIEKGIYD